MTVAHDTGTDHQDDVEGRQVGREGGEAGVDRSEGDRVEALGRQGGEIEVEVDLQGGVHPADRPPGDRRRQLRRLDQRVHGDDLARRRREPDAAAGQQGHTGAGRRRPGQAPVGIGEDGGQGGGRDVDHVEADRGRQLVARSPEGAGGPGGAQAAGVEAGQVVAAHGRTCSGRVAAASHR